MRSIWLAAVGAILAVQVAAQAFPAPSVQREGPGGTRIGLLGFGVRGGADFAGDGSAVFGIAIDAGNLFVNRLRLRPSAEIGFLNGSNTYVASFEGVYRLGGDNEAVIPYLGAGVAIAGHTECDADAECPGVWINTVLGIEVRYRSTFNWLIEYHALDGFQRNRVYLGFTTRRGN
jgi:hypothetical protein